MVGPPGTTAWQPQRWSSSDEDADSQKRSDFINISVHFNASVPPQEAPLSSIFSQYLSGLPAGAARKVRFHFDGSKVTGSQTAAQLDLEDGDIIEVQMCGGNV
uniref:NFATC2-interacting protein n=1 Tax=Cyprinodon variegatus TaxID=28743 RepID=A0A3Q2E667_CYPVA